MKIEDQVCSLEFAKKLKKLGVEQDSFFYWVEIGEHDLRLEFNIDKDATSSYLSAFTVSELGEMLPKIFYIDEDRYALKNGWVIKNRYMSNESEFWITTYLINGEPDYFKHFESEKEADARAEMLIYLIENKLIEVN